VVRTNYPEKRQAWRRKESFGNSEGPYERIMRKLANYAKAQAFDLPGAVGFEH